MGPRGYFGKIPSAKDFVFQGVPIRTTERWAGYMAEWLARGNKTHRDDWRRFMLTSPIWRFALDRNIISAEGWIGLLAGSIDGAGRLFPFSAMIATDVDLGSRQPFEAIDGMLDTLEPAFLDFMEGAADRQDLAAAVELAATRSAAIQAGATGGSLSLPGIDEQAICFDGDMLMAHPRRVPAGEDPSGFSAWWHAGTSAAGSARCISRGMLPARAALPFFDADWVRHGWVSR